MFSCGFCDISENTSLTEHLWTTASIESLFSYQIWCQKKMSFVEHLNLIYFKMNYFWFLLQVRHRRRSGIFIVNFYFTPFSSSSIIDFNPFMMEAVIIQKPVHWFAEQINGLVPIWYDNGLLHERVNHVTLLQRRRKDQKLQF